MVALDLAFSILTKLQIQTAKIIRNTDRPTENEPCEVSPLSVYRSPRWITSWAGQWGYGSGGSKCRSSSKSRHFCFLLRDLNSDEKLQQSVIWMVNFRRTNTPFFVEVSGATILHKILSVWWCLIILDHSWSFFIILDHSCSFLMILDQFFSEMQASENANVLKSARNDLLQDMR